MKSRFVVLTAAFFGVVLVSSAVSYLLLHRMENTLAVGNPLLKDTQAWIHEAELSAEQLKALQPEEAALRKDLDVIQEQIVKERTAITSILNSTAAVVTGIDDHLNQIAGLEAAQQRLVMRQLIAMRNVMTPEQRSRFFTAMNQGMCTEYRKMSCCGEKTCVCGMCKTGKKTHHE